MTTDIKAAFFTNVMKAAAVAAATSLLGICGNAIMSTHDQGKTLEWHSNAIKELQIGQAKQLEAEQAVNVSVVRLEGKIDTLNQKIDDAQKREVADQSSTEYGRVVVAGK